jgi:hypothetical protein
MDVDQPENKKRFEVKKWSAVALWTWDMQVDVSSVDDLMGGIMYA